MAKMEEKVYSWFGFVSGFLPQHKNCTLWQTNDESEETFYRRDGERMVEIAKTRTTGERKTKTQLQCVTTLI